MAIPREFIQQLVMTCDIEDVVSSYVVLKREGRNKKCLCPFHSEKTPSMVVYPDTQSFYCFGCGTGGDVISFIMKIENLDYVESIKFLSQRYGLEVPSDSNIENAGLIRSRILEMNREAARFFHKCLKSPIGVQGLEYFKKRQLPAKVITKYGLGYAPNSWDSLIKHLKSKGFTIKEMEQAKLVSKGKNGSYYDFFRNRVMFPVIDLRGNVIAFGGRVLDDSKPKYLNSPETPVFKKSKNLFSLNFAKKVKLDNLILAEGYMDVIAINSAGFENVVATLGTALTPEQARLISKYTEEVIIAYDSDQAGQNATHRAINLLSEVGIMAKSLHIKDAKDPDEYIKKFGASRFKLLLDGASDVVKYELKTAKQKFDLDDALQKQEYIKRASYIIANVKGKIAREIYAGIVSKETEISTENILSMINGIDRYNQEKSKKEEWKEIQENKVIYNNKVNPQKRDFLLQSEAEEGIIQYLLRDFQLKDYILKKLSVDDFVTDFNKRVFKTIIDNITQYNELTFSEILNFFTPEEKNEIARIQARKRNEKFNIEVLDDYIKILLDYKESLDVKKVDDLDILQIEELRRKKQKKLNNN